MLTGYHDYIRAVQSVLTGNSIKTKPYQQWLTLNSNILHIVMVFLSVKCINVDGFWSSKSEKIKYALKILGWDWS